MRFSSNEKRYCKFVFCTTVHISRDTYGSLKLMVYSTVWQPYCKHVEVTFRNDSLSNNPSLPLLLPHTIRNSMLFLQELTAQHCAHLHAHAIKLICTGIGHSAQQKKRKWKKRIITKCCPYCGLDRTVTRTEWQQNRNQNMSGQFFKIHEHILRVTIL